METNGYPRGCLEYCVNLNKTQYFVRELGMGQNFLSIILAIIHFVKS